jgi:hypothetical protein
MQIAVFAMHVGWLQPGPMCQLALIFNRMALVDMELSREGAGAVPSTTTGHLQRLGQTRGRTSEPKRRAEHDDHDQAEHGADDADHDKCRDSSRDGSICTA